VILNNDEVAFPLVYLQVAEGRRLDVLPGVALQYRETGAYRAARSYWPDRLPPLTAFRIEPRVTRVPSPVLDAIVNHAGNRYPIVWDRLDGATFRRGRLVPYFHLALVVPPGHEPSDVDPGFGDALDLVTLFQDLLVTMRMPQADAFALWRLAIGPLTQTAASHYQRGDLEGAIAVDTLALGIYPDEPLVHFNRALAFEAAGMTAQAVADLERAYLGGHDPEAVLEAMQRLGFEAVPR
jgi:hypothetical protein